MTKAKNRANRKTVYNMWTWWQIIRPFQIANKEMRQHQVRIRLSIINDLWVSFSVKVSRLISFFPSSKCYGVLILKIDLVLKCSCFIGLPLERSKDLKLIYFCLGNWWISIEILGFQRISKSESTGFNEIHIYLSNINREMSKDHLSRKEPPRTSATIYANCMLLDCL